MRLAKIGPATTTNFAAACPARFCDNWGVTGDVPAQKLPADFPFDWCRRTLEQYLSLRKFYYGDYYPLTSYSQARDVWMAYQLDRPREGDGLIVALRRPDSPYQYASFVLHGLDAKATYLITNLDNKKQTQLTGAELQKNGVPIAIDPKPGSALVTYQRQRRIWLPVNDLVLTHNSGACVAAVPEGHPTIAQRLIAGMRECLPQLEVPAGRLTTSAFVSVVPPGLA